MKNITVYFMPVLKTLVLCSIIYFIAMKVAYYYFKGKSTTEVVLHKNKFCEYEDMDFFVFPVNIKEKSYYLCWDTGASVTALDKDVINDLGLDSIGKVRSSYRIGQSNDIRYNLVSLKIGEKKTRVYPIDAELEYRSMFIKDDLHGIIGQDIISKYCWLFDIKKGTVFISDKRIKIGDTACLELKFNINEYANPQTNINFNGIDVKNVEIDTGHPGLHFEAKIEQDMVYDFYFEHFEIPLNNKEGKSLFDSLQLQNPLNYKKGSSIRESNLTYCLFHNLNLNGTKLNNIVFSYGRSLDLQEITLTNRFFMQFDRMYYNPFDNFIRLYKDKDSENDVSKDAELKIQLR